MVVEVQACQIRPPYGDQEFMWKASLLNPVIICIQQHQSLILNLACVAEAVNDNVKGCRRAANLHRNDPWYECVRNQIRVCNLGLHGHVCVPGLRSSASECLVCRYRLCGCDVDVSVCLRHGLEGIVVPLSHVFFHPIKISNESF